MVFNKIDRVSSPGLVERFLNAHPQSVGVSARTQAGFPALFEALGSLLRPVREFLSLAVPHDAVGVIARLHAVGEIVESDYQGATAHLKVRLPPHLRAEFEPYVIEDLGAATGLVGN